MNLDRYLEVPVTGIWLQANAGSIRVLAEIDGRWRVLIDEINDGPISHIIEPRGIAKAPLDMETT